MTKQICGIDRETWIWACVDNAPPNSTATDLGRRAAHYATRHPTKLVDILQMAAWPRNVRLYHFEPVPNGVQLRWIKDGALAWRRLGLPEARALLLAILTMPEASRADNVIDASLAPS